MSSGIQPPCATTAIFFLTAVSAGIRTSTPPKCSGFIRHNVNTDQNREAKSLLVIGYGNTLRGDDGVGPKVVEQIEALQLPRVHTLACGLLTPELADPIARASRVIFVDAAVDAPREVQLRKLAPADSSQIMAHAADPRTILALARDVFGHAPEAWWLTIPVAQMGVGDELSELAQRGLQQAVKAITRAVIDHIP